MKPMIVVRRYGAQIVAGALGALMSAAALAQSDPFTSAVDTITGKVESYGAALVGLGAIGVVFMVALKYVKKLPRAS